MPNESTLVIFKPESIQRGIVGLALSKLEGLGLAMVHQIITEHHGTVQIGDGETGGTVFVVTIPEAQ